MQQLRSGDFQNALEYGKDMFKDNKDSLALDYYYYGISQLGVKDYQNAVTSLNKALEINPKDASSNGQTQSGLPRTGSGGQGS